MNLPATIELVTVPAIQANTETRAVLGIKFMAPIFYPISSIIL